MVTRKSHTHPRGFTLMEVLVAILIIFLLMGLLIVGVHHVRKAAKGGRDRVQATSLKNAVSMFTTEFKFLPPLVKDFDPQGPLRTTGGITAPRVYSFSDPAGQDPLALRT